MALRRVAVTGMGLVTPVGNDVASTWAALVAGSLLAGILVAIVGVAAKIVDRAMGGRPA